MFGEILLKNLYQKHSITPSHFAAIFLLCSRQSVIAITIKCINNVDLASVGCSLVRLAG